MILSQLVALRTKPQTRRRTHSGQSHRTESCVIARLPFARIAPEGRAFIAFQTKSKRTLTAAISPFLSFRASHLRDPNPKARTSDKADLWRAGQTLVAAFPASPAESLLAWLVTGEERYLNKAKEFR